jgi:hypothetical protein
MRLPTSRWALVTGNATYQAQVRYRLLAQTANRQDTGTVKTLGRKIIATVAALGVIGGASCFPPKHRSAACKERGAAFDQRVESIKQDAREQLKIGTKKGEVSRFFTEHGIPFTITDSEVTGTLNTVGCSPRGCGADSALIGVRVNVDRTGTVTGEPTVVGMYTDCV